MQRLSFKGQLLISVIAVFVALFVSKSAFLAVVTGVSVSFLNTGLDKLFIFLQHRLNLPAGQSFIMLVLSVLLRLSAVIGGLYIGFSFIMPAGVIIGFVAGHVGYMVDKLFQVSK